MHPSADRVPPPAPVQFLPSTEVGTSKTSTKWVLSRGSRKLAKQVLEIGSSAFVDGLVNMAGIVTLIIMRKA